MGTLCKQCVVQVADGLSRLGSLTEKIKQARINIVAVCAWVEAGRGRVMLVTEDHDKVCMAITPLVDECEFREVVLTRAPDEVGSLNRISRKLAEAGIELHLLYASAGEAGQAAVVLDTSDNARAAKLI